MNIEILIQAAEFLERRDREAEHGYASTLPEPDNYSRRRRTISQGSHSSRKSQGNRSTHNELEKNRRAHLRHCLENLKYKVPVGTESSRHTTLSLLTKAKLFIKSLEDKEGKQRMLKDQLYREQRFLRRRLEQMGKNVDASDCYRARVERSFSECSTSTHSTSNCSSESDEVDIVGYGSSDDSNMNDNSSDGGFTVRKLTLNDVL